MDEENTVVSWAFSLAAEVLILKNLIHIVDKKISWGGADIDGYNIIITAKIIPWIISLSVAIWILVQTHRYSKELKTCIKENQKIVYNILFLINIIVLTISAILLIDVDTFTGRINVALILLGISHLIIDAIDIFLFQKKENIQNGYYEKIEKGIARIVIVWSLRLFFGISLISIGFIPSNKVNIYLELFIILNIVILILSDMYSAGMNYMKLEGGAELKKSPELADRKPSA
jgi:hypothetical protein